MNKNNSFQGRGAAFPVRLHETNSSCSDVTIDEVKLLVHACLLAPSGNNCQPFCFEWNGHTLKVFHDSKCAKADINNNNNASKLTFGTLLKNLEIVARSINIKLFIEITDNFDQSAWCIIKAEREIQTTHPLLQAIHIRITDRRPYQKCGMEKNILDNLKAIAKKHDLVEFYFSNKLEPDFEKFIFGSEEYIWRHLDYFKYLAKWMRLNKKEKKETKNGLTAESLSVNTPLIILLKLFRKYPRLIKIMFPIIRFQSHKLIKKLLEHSSGLWLLTSKNSSDKSIIQTGQCAMEMWLYLNLNSYGVHPMSVSSLNSFDAQTGILPKHLPKKLYHHFQKGHLHFKQQFNIPDDEYPLWLFRTGKISKIEDKQYTKRMKIEDVLTIVKSSLHRTNQNT